MLKLLDIGIENVTAFRAAGKLTETEVSRVLKDMKRKITVFGSIGVYMELESLDGIELSAVLKEFRFLFDVGLSGIKTEVLVTDKRWMKTLVKVENRLFKSINMKYFPPEEKASAVAFLKEALQSDGS